MTVASVRDPSSPRPLCSLTFGAYAQFVNRSTIAYANFDRDSGSIVKLDLDSGKRQTLVSWTAAGFLNGFFAFSPDGKSMAYLLSLPGDSNFSAAASVQLHLVSNGQDRLITTLPGIPGRGVAPDDDSLMLSFSPDGNYFALVETFTAPGSLDRARFQVRRSDGTLVSTVPSGKSVKPFSVVLAAYPTYEPGAGTMAVWSGTGSRLYFRSDDGVIRLEPGSFPSLVAPGLKWIRPHASPDGHWISYTVRDKDGLPNVGLLDVTGKTEAHLISQSARDDPVFLSSTKLWYREVRACVAGDACGMKSSTIPTGKTFIYDLVTRKETPSSMGSIRDVWPRASP